MRWAGMLICVLLAGVLVSPAFAAEVAGGDTYELAAGEVITDDLYVSAREVIIAGTVEGDLIATGAYIEVSGTVTGDVLIAGAGITINGTVEDDLRVAGAGIDIAGTIGGDVLAAGGGGMFAAPINLDGRSITQGVRIHDNAQIGGDALLAGGQGTISGAIGDDLRASMADLTLAAQVGGDAQLNAGTIAVQEPAQVAGVLRYTSEEPISPPDGVAADVVYTPPPEGAEPTALERTLTWLTRTVLVLLGFALLGWLLLRFRPAALARPARAIAAQPGRATLYGMLGLLGLMIIPLLSALLVFLMILFFGWFPGVVLGLALFSILALLWFLSPLITGAWLGQRLSGILGRAPDSLPVLLSGVLLLALLTHLPYLGWLISLVSFVFAFGGLILARRLAARERRATVAHG